MMITLLDAARQTGKSKGALLKAIKTGRLSATKGANGEWLVDPAELFRVYTVVKQGEQKLAIEHSRLPIEIEILRERVAHLEGELRRRDDDVEDYRQRLTASEEERRKNDAQLKALLTDQREKKQQEPPSQSLWRWLFRVRGR